MSSFWCVLIGLIYEILGAARARERAPALLSVVLKPQLMTWVQSARHQEGRDERKLKDAFCAEDKMDGTVLLV